jgi:cytochrome c biogenesis protein CcdA
MAETITPVVHGGRRGPWLLSSLLHVGGATASAALLGAALGGAGALLGAPWGDATPAVVGAVALLYFAREAFRVPVPLPDRKRQVPEWWRTFFSPAVAAFLYGAGLGVGFLTYLTFGTFAAVAAGAAASGDAATGALLCGAFGLGRGVAVLLVTARAAPTTIDRLDEVAASEGPRRVNAAALAGVVAAAVAALL